MRRFSRRRRGGARSGGGATPIDAGSVLAKIAELGLVPTESLEPFAADEVPAEVAAVGSGESKSGGRVFVTFSPREASHAVVAALALGGRLAETEADAPSVYAVAPSWSEGARRLLGLAGQLPFELNAVAAPSLGEEGPRVRPQGAVTAAGLSPAQIAGYLAGPADRDLFLRAARGLEGLAAKHGAALRGNGRAVDFVLLARRVAELRAENGGISLTTLLPSRSTSRLTVEGLSGSLDALEGQLRKRLNDRHTREGEEGLRARAISAFREWHSLRALVPWPLAGNDHEVIDWVGVDVEGRPVVGAAREELGLAELASVLEGALALQASLPAVLVNAPPPVVFDAPRLVVGGRTIAAGVGRVLDALTLTHELFEIRGSGELELRAIGAGEAPSAPARPARRRPERTEAPRRDDSEDSDEAPREARAEREGGDAPEADDDRGGSGRGRSRRGRGRGRGRRGRGRSDEDGPDAAASDDRGDDADRDRDAGRGRDADRTRDAGSDAGEEKPTPRFDEVSLFDLDDEPTDRDGGGRGRRRRRGRRRPRSGGEEGRGGDGGGDSSSESGSSAGADVPAGRKPRTDPPDSATDSDSDSDDLDLDDDLLVEVDDDIELEEVPDFEVPAAPAYEDDDEEGGDSGEEEGPVRKARRQPAPEVVEELPALPRRRSAIVAHADRDSIVAAVLIARDVRMIEGIWIYPQDELMSFFRGVATDLRDDTPIYVVGFTPKPAIDVLQTASLYRDRLQWFDHHDWPPEDLQALRDLIGEAAVHVTPGAGSSLPGVLECCSRRSRFTDKLVDLMAARFTEHDFERWGRVWSWRLAEMTQKTGDRRMDVEGLLSGRPSDLAKEASRAEIPPIPPEVEFVSRRDFRLVHFAGYGLVVVEVPDELDLHLTARVARERYGASLALATRPDSEIVVFSGDELSGRRSLDLGALVEHVANKLEWVEKLTDTDHVARMRVRQLPTHPERLDEIVAEIAMGRSILER